MVRGVRRINASRYDYDDPRRYITLKDCLSEPEVLQSYCRKHPRAVCLGGYIFFGCRPKGKKKEEFVKYIHQTGVHIRKVDSKVLEPSETYCGRKIPYRFWRGKKRLENRIWAIAGLGIPDLLDEDLVIEAKGGLPSSQKVRTALGQLLFYREHEPSFKLGFLFPKIWFKAENLQNDFGVFEKYRITILPI